jgi:hypothetical protein
MDETSRVRPEPGTEKRDAHEGRRWGRIDRSFPMEFHLPARTPIDCNHRLLSPKIVCQSAEIFNYGGGAGAAFVHPCKNV